MENLFGISLNFGEMLIRFLICVVVNWIIVDRLYYQKSKRRDFYFTYILIGISIFFIVFFMIFVLEDMKGKTGIGVGIGLFGIFSIMRYRTDAMPVREMTYLFLIICLSVVNALASTMTYTELLITNAVIVFSVWICEKRLKVVSIKLIQYDRIELIEPEKRQELIADIKQRTGLKVTKIDVGAIDFLHDMVMLRVKYQPDGTADRELDNKFKIKNSEYANN